MVKSDFSITVKCDECKTKITIKVPIVQRWQDEPTYEIDVLNQKLRDAGWYVTQRMGAFHRNLCPNCGLIRKPKGRVRSPFIKSKEKQNVRKKT